MVRIDLGAFVISNNYPGIVFRKFFENLKGFPRVRRDDREGSNANPVRHNRGSRFSGAALLLGEGA